jgi:hypothetical protein
VREANDEFDCLDLRRIEEKIKHERRTRLSGISETDNGMDRSDTLQTDGNQDGSIYGNASVFLSSLALCERIIAFDSIRTDHTYTYIYTHTHT